MLSDIRCSGGAIEGGPLIKSRRRYPCLSKAIAPWGDQISKKTRLPGDIHGEKQEMDTCGCRLGKKGNPLTAGNKPCVDSPIASRKKQWTRVTPTTRHEQDAYTKPGLQVRPKKQGHHTISAIDPSVGQKERFLLFLKARGGVGGCPRCLSPVPPLGNNISTFPFLNALVHAKPASRKDERALVDPVCDISNRHGHDLECAACIGGGMSVHI